MQEAHLILEKQAIEIGADIIHDGEDYCGNTGLLMPMEHFKEFVLPGLRRVIEVVKENNKPFVKHCDGNIWPLLDLFVEEGIDASQGGGHILASSNSIHAGFPRRISLPW